jgi:hypothetical protein
VLATLLNFDAAEKMKGVKILGVLVQSRPVQFLGLAERPIWCNPNASRRIVCTEAAVIIAPYAPSLAPLPQPHQRAQSPAGETKPFAISMDCNLLLRILIKSNKQP